MGNKFPLIVRINHGNVTIGRVGLRASHFLPSYKKRNGLKRDLLLKNNKMEIHGSLSTPTNAVGTFKGISKEEIRQKIGRRADEFLFQKLGEKKYFAVVDIEGKVREIDPNVMLFSISPTHFTLRKGNDRYHFQIREDGYYTQVLLHNPMTREMLVDLKQLSLLGRMVISERLQPRNRCLNKLYLPCSKLIFRIKSTITRSTYQFRRRKWLICAPEKS